MSLQQYEIDFSTLSPEEKNNLIKHIEDHSYTGIHLKPDCQSAVFFVENDSDITNMNLPTECRLSQIS